MAEFAYNYAKNISTGYIFFKLNYSYQLRIFFKNKIDLYFRSYSANILVKKLKNLILICQQHLLHTQKL